MTPEHVAAAAIRAWMWTNWPTVVAVACAVAFVAWFVHGLHHGGRVIDDMPARREPRPAPEFEASTFTGWPVPGDPLNELAQPYDPEVTQTSDELRDGFTEQVKAAIDQAEHYANDLPYDQERDR